MYEVQSTMYNVPSEGPFESEHESLNCTKYQEQCTKYLQKYHFYQNGNPHVNP